jgi:4-amino-4-deoxy-L-arabinose transferase-like glycosyltransferase
MPKIPFWIFLILGLLYFSAIRVDTMDVDASQYAEISREMAATGSWLQVYEYGRDYLDKPPFLFWVSALSMKIFGANNFGYKFPSLLFALWALYATYRLGKILYNEKTGRLAALILGTCQGMFLMTNDIRTDTILMSAVITTIWMIREFEVDKSWRWLIGSAVFIAIGMMTKGPIAVIVPALCFVPEWLMKRKWNMFFNPRWIVMVLIIAALLIPMSVGLYQQFDLQPEKTVNGLQNVSGLRFFYWTQSFGRITGENVWNNSAGPEFLLLNMLWSFQPWIFIFLPAIIINIITIFRQRLQLAAKQEWITTGGFLLSYMALASSKYQLPHYIFVVFPLAATITAAFLQKAFENENSSLLRILKPLQIILSALILIAASLTLFIVFPASITVKTIWIVLLAAWVIVTIRSKHKIVWATTCAMIIANIALTHHFYHNLMQYQAGSVIGKYIRANNIPIDKVSSIGINDPLKSIHFYANEVLFTKEQNLATGAYLIAGEAKMDSLTNAGFQFDTLQTGTYTRVSTLTSSFLNPQTRGKSVSPYFFVRVR